MQTLVLRQYGVIYQRFPKYEESDLTAIDKLEETFWRMLSEKPYEDITVAKFAEKANVNHKTIYYHFKSMNGMAEHMISGTLNPELLHSFLDFLLYGEGTDIPSVINKQDYREHWSRIHIAAVNSSGYIRELLHDRIADDWLSYLAIPYTKLEPVEKLELNFMLEGILSVFRSPDVAIKPEILAELMQSPLMDSARKTVLSVIDNHR